jgi:DNA-binding IclR family transcriptional regulator
LEEQGIVQIISVPIRSLNNVLVGFVQFAMIKNKIEVTEEMEEDLVEAAQRISGYLHY